MITPSDFYFFFWFITREHERGARQKATPSSTINKSFHILRPLQDSWCPLKVAVCRWSISVSGVHFLRLKFHSSFSFKFFAEFNMKCQRIKKWGLPHDLLWLFRWPGHIYVYSEVNNIIYYSFKIFPRFWLAKSTRLILHNQLPMIKFGRILCLARKWRQKCSVHAG